MEETVVSYGEKLDGILKKLDYNDRITLATVLAHHDKNEYILEQWAATVADVSAALETGQDISSKNPNVDATISMGNVLEIFDDMASFFASVNSINEESLGISTLKSRGLL